MKTFRIISLALMLATFVIAIVGCCVGKPHTIVVFALSTFLFFVLKKDNTKKHKGNIKPIKR